MGEFQLLSKSLRAADVRQAGRRSRIAHHLLLMTETELVRHLFFRCTSIPKAESDSLTLQIPNWIILCSNFHVYSSSFVSPLLDGTQYTSIRTDILISTRGKCVRSAAGYGDSTYSLCWMTKHSSNVESGFATLKQQHVCQSSSCLLYKTERMCACPVERRITHVLCFFVLLKCQFPWYSTWIKGCIIIMRSSVESEEEVEFHFACFVSYQHGNKVAVWR